MVLDGIEATFDASRLYCVLGASGSEKTTFLECSSGLARPSSGSVLLAGTDLTRLPDRKLAPSSRDRIRRPTALADRLAVGGRDRPASRATVGCTGDIAEAADNCGWSASSMDAASRDFGIVESADLAGALDSVSTITRFVVLLAVVVGVPSAMLALGMLDPGYTSGGAVGLVSDEFAASTSLAGKRGWDVGRQYPVPLPDGSTQTLTLRFTHDRDLIFGQILMPNTTVATATYTPYPAARPVTGAGNAETTASRGDLSARGQVEVDPSSALGIAVLVIYCAAALLGSIVLGRQCASAR